MLPVYSSNIMNANRIHKMCQLSVGMGSRKYVAMHCRNQQVLATVYVNCTHKFGSILSLYTDSIYTQKRDIPAVPDNMALSGLRVVLVAPKTEANIGAVARACGNYEVRLRKEIIACIRHITECDLH